MNFIGRENELKILNSIYKNDNYEGILIYGRRRIGKSEIIKESIKNIGFKKIYYECQKVSEENNVMNMCELIGEKFNIPTPNFKTLKEVLEYLFSYSVNNKIVLVIDEYPYLRGKSDSYDSIIQTVIDKYKMNCKMKFILCGSYIDIMKSLQNDSNPLFGRFTYKLNIKQMDYYESALFYKDFSNEDKVRLYSVFGGIPYYNQFINSNLTVKENIINLIASPNARLLYEAENFLNDEISKLKNTNECFLAIAAGYKKFKDILDHSYVSSSPSLVDVLTKLVNMDIIDKIYPINDDSEKKSMYIIKDRLTLFYYRYIFKRKSMFNIMNSDMFYDEFIYDDFETKYVPREFEQISLQYFIRQNLLGNINPPLYKIGKYYYDDKINKKNGEFDVVTLNKNGYSFYEVKFINKSIDNSIVNEELYQLSKLNIKYNKIGFISKSGFNIDNSNLYDLISLDKIYE